MKTRRILQPFAGLIAAGVLAVPATALAQPPDWSVTGAGSGAAPVGGPYDAEYGVGFMGGAGLYRSLLPSLGIGLRVDGGGIAGEEEYESSLGDGGIGFGALSPALRYRPLQQLGLEQPNGNRGLYLELAGGVGLLEDQVQPVVAPGAGYIFDVGNLGIGPTARYLQVVAGDGDAPEGEDVRIMTVGVELVFLDQDRGGGGGGDEYTPAQPPRTFPTAPAASTGTSMSGEQASEQAGVQRQEIEQVAGTDEPNDMSVSSGDRRVIDERVFFDYDEATLRAEGKRELDQIAAMYRSRQPGEKWTALRVSGFADQRGPESYNLELSRQRAQNVREYLVSRGLPESLVNVRAYGEERPVVPNPDSPSEYQQNRRVQFEIIRDRSGQSN